MNEQRGKGEGIMTAGQNKDGGKVLRYPPGRWKQRSPVPLARVMVIVGRYTSSVDMQQVGSSDTCQRGWMEFCRRPIFHDEIIYRDVGMANF